MGFWNRLVRSIKGKTIPVKVTFESTPSNFWENAIQKIFIPDYMPSDRDIKE